MPAKSTLESYPVKIWSEKPLLVERSLNFLPPRCILHNWVHLGGQAEWLIFLGMRVTGGGGGGRGRGLPFFENRKKCPDFWKKESDCVHPYVKFTIQNVVLRVSKRKSFKTFPCGAVFSGIFDDTFIGVI